MVVEENKEKAKEEEEDKPARLRHSAGPARLRYAAGAEENLAKKTQSSSKEATENKGLL